MMTQADLQAFCLTFKGASEDYPFDADTAVFKVKGKMFALMPLRTLPASVNLKCDPLESEVLRQNYPAITPGYHMDKRHWITVLLDGSLTDEFVQDLIHKSYELVVKGLKRADRDALKPDSNNE